MIPEMKTGLMGLGLDLSEQDIAHIVSIADYDNSGSIEFEEFVTVFSKSQVAARVRLF